MNDYELEQGLRAFFREEVGHDEVAPPGLRATLAEIAERDERTGLFGSRRTLVLMAAVVMLTVAALGTALAIASGLIDPPWEAPDTLRPIVVGDPCSPSLPDGVLLTWRSGSTETEPDRRYTILADGRVLRQVGLNSTDWSDGVEGPMGWRHGWTQRSLTPEGLTALIDAVAGSGLPSCRAVYLPDLFDAITVTVQTNEGPALLEFGPVANELQPSSDAEMAAATALIARFADADLEVPRAQWLDADWTPFDGQRWAVFVASELLEGSQPQTAFWDVSLPDGSTLRTFGEELGSSKFWVVTDEEGGTGIYYGERPPGTTNIQEGTRTERCGIVSTLEAEAIRDVLEAVTRDSFDFAELPGGGFALSMLVPPGDRSEGSVSIELAMPPEGDCTDMVPPRPPKPPPASPAPEVAGLAACDLIPKERLEARIEYTGTGDWASCGYDPNPDLPAGGDVYLRTQATSAEEALELVQMQFGATGFVTDQIEGRTVYLNGCVAAGARCAPAIAIAAEPHYIVIVGYPPEDGTDMEPGLRALAEAIIGNL